MPIIVVSVKATKQDGDLLFIELTYQDQTVEMTVKRDMTLVEMAQIAVTQSFPELPDTVFDGDVQIEFHVDEDGNRIVDSAEKI